MPTFEKPCKHPDYEACYAESCEGQFRFRVSSVLRTLSAYYGVPCNPDFLSIDWDGHEIRVLVW